jgi:hypothetical protein
MSESWQQAFGRLQTSNGDSLDGRLAPGEVEEFNQFLGWDLAARREDQVRRGTFAKGVQSVGRAELIA